MTRPKSTTSPTSMAAGPGTTDGAQAPRGMSDSPLAEVMRPIGPGLWHWTAPHPHWRPYDPERRRGWDWEKEVGCVCLEAPETLVLIDPLAPPPATPERKAFWRALDAAAHR